MNINDLPIPILIPIHQRDLILLKHDYSGYLQLLFLLFHRLADPTKKILKPFCPNVISPIGHFEVASEGNWATLCRIALWECLGTKLAPVSSITL